jgi:Baseplate J-like protein
MTASDNSSMGLVLDTCGCCEPTPSPEPVFNRPGLPALSYRIGTHASFLDAMLTELRTQILPSGITLESLTTRATDDPAIALMDAWATVADVLTFYQERIANEGFLRTATERQSVLQLARAIGYELSPGVAAGTYLAFTLQDAAGSPASAAIATGTKVQSVPPQGKLPQTFETVEDIVARPEWNALHPIPTYPQVFHSTESSVYLQGTATQLQPGDSILIVGDERLNDPNPADESLTAEDRWDYRIVAKVTPYPDLKITQVEWVPGLGGGGIAPTTSNPKVYALRQLAHIFGYNAPDWRSMSDQVQLHFLPPSTLTAVVLTSAEFFDWPGLDPINSGSAIVLDAVYPKILVDSWIVLAQQSDSVRTAMKELYRVKAAGPVSVADFTLTGQGTRLTLDTDVNLVNFGRRQTAAFAQSEELPWVDRPFTDPRDGKVILTDPLSQQDINPVGGSDHIHIQLDRIVLGLSHQQILLISGKWVRLTTALDTLKFQPADGSELEDLGPKEKEVLQVLGATAPAPDATRIWHVVRRSTGAEGFVTAPPSAFIPHTADKDDPVVSEAVVVDHVDLAEDGKSSNITLLTPVQNIYEPRTVTISANVARATHGETVKEVLGSGDAAQVNQSFILKKPPLTYTSAATASGSQSTLKVRVNDVLWEETPSLYGLGPRDQNYIVRIDDSGKPTLTFGNGLSGERPPTGVENIAAYYRSGIGPDGDVDADALTLLQTRPLGVRSVTNPLPATGAAAPEHLAEARTNAPLKVQTLDRVVSLEDYENFAAAFAGIGKAQAAAIWNKNNRIVFLTLAAADGNALDPSSMVRQNLQLAIQDFHDPVQRVQLGSYTKLTFAVKATVLIDPRYIADEVLANANAALLETFSFARRSFGQPVTGAEVVMVMQGVNGVVAVELESLVSDLPIPTAPPANPVDTILNASGARFDAGIIHPAELLLIRRAGNILKGTNP